MSYVNLLTYPHLSGKHCSAANLPRSRIMMPDQTQCR